MCRCFSAPDIETKNPRQIKAQSTPQKTLRRAGVFPRRQIKLLAVYQTRLLKNQDFLTFGYSAVTVIYCFCAGRAL